MENNINVYATRLPDNSLKLFWETEKGFGSFTFFAELNEKDRLEIDSEFTNLESVIAVYNAWVTAGKPYGVGTNP